jgi:hypothetical protein
VGWSQEHLEDAARQARAGMKRIMDVARQKGEPAADALKTASQDLVQLTQTVVTQARQTAETLITAANGVAQRCADRLEERVPRVEQVIQQTTRWVLQGEKVPAPEKILSLFEPHSAILCNGKAGKPVEFGRVLWLGEVEGGIITFSQAIPTTRRRSCRASTPTSSSSLDRPTLSLATASWRPRPTKPRRSSVARSGSCCRAPGARRRRGKCMSASPGFGRAVTGVPTSKGASAGSNAAMAWIAAATTATRAWLAGSAGA